MATTQEWVEAARPKTLPASLAPVFMGIGAAAGIGAFSFPRSLLALLVGLGFQIGVNFSNDYSDGIRGTDAVGKRIGPTRLTGSGAAAAGQVLGAAIIFYALAGVCGLILVAMVHAWWLLVLGILAVAAAWFYTGGRHPYGYMSGVSELMVFLFFGWMAVLGTVWVQSFSLPWPVWLGATGTGLLSCALLMINNLRDIPGDTEAGKRTLAVTLGDKKARVLFQVYLIIAWIIGIIVVPTWWGKILFALAFGGLCTFVSTRVYSGAKGKALIICLRLTGQVTLFYGLFLAIFWTVFGI